MCATTVSSEVHYALISLTSCLTLSPHIGTAHAVATSSPTIIDFCCTWCAVCGTCSWYPHSCSNFNYTGSTGRRLQSSALTSKSLCANRKTRPVAVKAGHCKAPARQPVQENVLTIRFLLHSKWRVQAWG